jgi:hypothetical protein
MLAEYVLIRSERFWERSEKRVRLDGGDSLREWLYQRREERVSRRAKIL